MRYDDQIVHDPAGGREQQRVFGLADGERGERANERGVERPPGLRAVQDDLAHVGEVEQSGGGADGVVLGEVAGVADRHLPAGEIGERDPGGLVCVVQRGEALAVLRGHEFSDSPAIAGG